MFTLYTTVARTDGALEQVRHGVYDTRIEAERIGDNLRRLYDWVKSYEVREEAVEQALKPEKRMTGSVRKKPVQKKKSS